MRIFGISGLGADDRVFKEVNKHMTVPIEYVPWIPPEKRETLAQYSKRLAMTIDTKDEFSLVGVSFGGMIATEMNKVIKPNKTVIISSAASRKELPRYFRGAGRLKLVPYFPKKLIYLPKPLMDVVTSLTDENHRALVHEIMRGTDRDFLKWAVQSILTWDNDELPLNLKRIHGNTDRLLPPKAEIDELIEGGHMVILEKAEEMAGLIQRELNGW